MKLLIIWLIFVYYIAFLVLHNCTQSNLIVPELVTKASVIWSRTRSFKTKYGKDTT